MDKMGQVLRGVKGSAVGRLVLFISLAVLMAVGLMAAYAPPTPVVEKGVLVTLAPTPILDHFAYLPLILKVYRPPLVVSFPDEGVTVVVPWQGRVVKVVKLPLGTLEGLRSERDEFQPMRLVINFEVIDAETDGKTLASGSDDKTIILWDVATSQPFDPALIGGDVNFTATMTDDLAAGVLEYVSPTVTGGAVYTVGQILWTGLVTHGQEVTITYQVTVPSTLSPGDMVTNTANAVYLGKAIYDTAMVKVAGQPEVSAWKRVWNGSIYTTTADAYPTSLITYTLTVSNSGTDNASVSLLDSIPVGTTYQRHEPGLLYSPSPKPAVYTATTVISQSQRVFTYVVKVNAGKTVGEIPNQFSYTWDGSGSLSTGPVTVTVHSPLSNSVKMVDKTTANVDDTLLYTIELNNDALEQDVTAMVTDTIPEYTTFITGSQGTSYADGKVTWNGMITASSSVELTFTAKVASAVPQFPMELINRVTVNDGLGNPEFELAPVTTTVQGKVLVTKTVVPTTAYPGSVLSYKIVVSPTGGSSAYLSDPIPAHTTYVPGSVSGGAYYPASDRVVLLTSAAVTVTFQVTVATPLATPAAITNTAYITDFGTGIEFTKEAVTQLTSPLTVSKSVISMAPAGQEVTWKISITNRADYATTAILTDVLPAGVEWITITRVVSDTGSAGYVDATRTLTWTGDVAGGGVVTISFPVTVTKGLTDGLWIANEATINDGQGTILTASGGLTVSSYIYLGTSKKSASSSPLPGETITFTINLSNTGNMDATGITVTDTIPVSMTYVSGSASDGATWDGMTLTWSDLSLNAQASRDITFQATVNDDVAKGAVITNTAWISQSTLSAAVIKFVTIIPGVLTDFHPSIELQVKYMAQDVESAAGLEYLVLAFWDGEHWVAFTEEKHRFALKGDSAGGVGYAWVSSWGDRPIAWGRPLR